jgi:hypothetical protein
VDPDEIFGLMLIQKSLNEARYSPDGGGVLALARGKWSRDEGVKRAVNQRIAVDEKEPR